MTPAELKSFRLALRKLSKEAGQMAPKATDPYLRGQRQAWRDALRVAEAIAEHGALTSEQIDDLFYR